MDFPLPLPEVSSSSPPSLESTPSPSFISLQPLPVSSTTISSIDSTSREDCQLWVGGIPQPFATLKRLSTALSTACLQGGVAAPSIQFLQKKGYKQQSQLLAYAFVAFPSADCAARALLVLDQLQVAPGFTLSARPRNSSSVSGGSKQRVFKPYMAPIETKSGGELLAGEDPSLEAQLAPIFALPRPRWEAFLTAYNLSLNEEETAAQALQKMVEHLEVHPRPMRCVRGREIPSSLRDPLLAALQAFPWPLHNERSKVASEKYMVLNRAKRHTSSEGSPRSTLFDLCHSLLESMLRSTDETFVNHYTHIAVTKNFMGSPHVDHLDTTYQFALSLGAFTGGELCVDPEVGALCVTTTRDRLVKFDGRFTHWVRGKAGGERYSVVFFSNNPVHATTKSNCLFEAWLDPEP